MSTEMAYIGRCPCGCGAIPLATVDRPEYAKDVAKFVAKAIRDGYFVERVPLGDIRMSRCTRQQEIAL